MATTYTSQASGNWSDTTKWSPTPGAGGPSGDGNLALIANGHGIHLDSAAGASQNGSVTIGDSGTVANLAISTSGTGGTGTLTVDSGCSLTVLSNVKQGNATWTISSGCTITFGNTSTATTWQVADASSQANAKLVMSGTSGSHITATATTAGKGRFTTGSFTNAEYDCSYVDFSNLGDSSTASVTGNVAFTTGSHVFRFANCTWTTCGGVATSLSMTAANTISFDTCTFTSTQTAYCFNFSTTNALTGGARLINNCTLDKTLGNSSHFKDYTITGNFFAGLPSILISSDNRLAQFSGNFQVQSSSPSAVNVPSNISSYLNTWNYWHIHSSSSQLTNVHGLGFPIAATSIECSGIIFDPGNTDAAGDLIFPPASTGAGSTMQARYNLVLPIGAGAAAGASPGKLISCNNDMANLTLTANHNTVCVVGVSEVGIVQYGETYKGRVGMIDSCRSNIAFTPSGQTAGAKVQKIATTALAGTVSVTNGSANVTGSSTTFTTKLVVGDWVVIASDTTPYKVQSITDDTHLVLTSNYGGSTGSGKTIKPFVKNAIYNASFDAADYNAGFGLVTGTDGKGYNAEISGGSIFEYTPGAHDVACSRNPFYDSSRNIATWAVSKGLASSGDTYQQKIDAAYTYLKASPAVRNVELIDYVKAGFAVTDISLNNAGHDGVTMGALAWQLSGSIGEEEETFNIL